MNIYLEIFGYLGTLLIVVSMLMTSVTRLRVFNISGSVISMIYAVVCHTWPIALLNLSLITINVVQLIRAGRCARPIDSGEPTADLH